MNHKKVVGTTANVFFSLSLNKLDEMPKSAIQFSIAMRTRGKRCKTSRSKTNLTLDRCNSRCVLDIALAALYVFNLFLTFRLADAKIFLFVVVAVVTELTMRFDVMVEKSL